MAYRFFQIAPHGNGDEVRELNAFLRAQRVVRVEKEWCADGAQSHWAFCVEYVERAGEQGGKGQVDYKEVLGAAEFAVFARLRQLRKEVAEAGGRPVFAVFTNEQLAEMVRRKCRTAEQLGRIPGVGASRIERYAGKFLSVLAEEAASPRKPGEAKQGEEG